jgi:GAF domain-containing protein
MPYESVVEAAANAVARADKLETILDTVLQSLTVSTGIASGAVFLRGTDPGPLRLAAWVGFGDPDGLAAAVRRPGHPIAATLEDGVAAFDVRPVAPGGPAFRAHLPLLVGRDGRDEPVGVLALAYDEPVSPELRGVLETIADLLAVAASQERSAG